MLAGLQVPFLCSETHELGEELVASYLYQVQLYHWLETNDFGRFLTDNVLVHPRLSPQAAKRYSSVDRWASYLERRWAEGCHNRTQLWRELHAQGADFAKVTLRRWLRIRFGVRG